ncbi:Oxidoreductase OXR1 [Pseudocercospora fuligena]|uniref:Oxidoreductase OXR1 n=1 Tax=Pseudocercospora fuligena TaxID=685502 RepID=A0A8H6R7F4_9PEZI|nr:Oxidoreductase OXR1 [Pseudocercospora fuligena]
MAAKMKVVEPSINVTLVHSRNQLLSAEPLPDEIKQMSLDCLRKGGVEVILGKGRITSISTTEGDDGKPVQKLTLGDGSQLTASHVISAISQQVPSTTYLPKSCLDEDGLVKIDNKLQFLPDQPNNEHHYATGDICKWSGIKRCGAAMAMGVRAADNIHQHILNQRASTEINLTPWPEVPPMIALACGKSAVIYDPVGGARCGEEEMKIYFRDDLCFKGCWDHAGLSEPWRIDSPHAEGHAIPQVKGY